MLLKDAIEIAKSCGLETYGEAYYNIRLHAISTFDSSDFHSELKELNDDIQKESEEKRITVEELLEMKFNK